MNPFDYEYYTDFWLKFKCFCMIIDIVELIF